MLGACDADYKFLFLEVGGQGAVWNTCKLKTALQNNLLSVPKPHHLPNMNENCFKIPYYLAADDAFGLNKFTMKPYSGRPLALPEQVYNYRYD